jgi:4-amino-4-deoxy-L-arabinose transferase-like glycosyltransferase
MDKIEISSDKLFPILAGLMLLSLLINLGVQPIYLEEPRRAMVAMEMVENNNYIVPTQLGEYYYKKPPVFNWLIIASARLFGDFSPWALRLPTIISTFLASLLLFFVGRQYVYQRFGWFLALLFASSGAIYYYFSLIGEIDLFYTLITIACFFAVFHFQQMGNYLLLFIFSYSLAAVGLLTKGLPSIPFLALTLLSWLIYSRAWRKLFSWQHLMGILSFGVLVGGYALAYHTYNPIQNYLTALFSESVERTAVDNSVGRLIGHLFSFPLDTIKDSLPATLLLLFLIRKDWRKLILSNPLITFSAITFIVNFALYWLSPGARQRYIYMLYPFLIIIGLYAYEHRSEGQKWAFITFRILVWVAVGALMAGSLAINWIPTFDFLSYRLVLSLVGFTGLLGVGYWYYTHPSKPLIALVMAAIAFRLFFDFCIPAQRAHDSAGQRNRDKAIEIHEQVGEDQLYIYRNARFSFTTVYYLNQLRGQTLRSQDELKEGAYFIAPDSILADYPARTDLEFSGFDYKLIKVEANK